MITIVEDFFVGGVGFCKVECKTPDGRVHDVVAASSIIHTHAHNRVASPWQRKALNTFSPPEHSEYSGFKANAFPPHQQQAQSAMQMSLPTVAHTNKRLSLASIMKTHADDPISRRPQADHGRHLQHDLRVTTRQAQLDGSIRVHLVPSWGASFHAAERRPAEMVHATYLGCATRWRDRG